VVTPFTREDMVDAIATAITDSMDVDWTSRTGAEAVVRNCGVFELYDALQSLSYAVATTAMPEAACERLLPFAMKAKAALAKVRGE
jgi:hypothetical protein